MSEPATTTAHADSAAFARDPGKRGRPLRIAEKTLINSLPDALMTARRAVPKSKRTQNASLIEY